MVAPSIRTVASYQTHQEYSVRFLGHQFIVTVTPDSSVISRWIRDVLFKNRLSSHPLVVGVGVQWTPFTYSSDPPPNNHYADSPPNNHYADSPPGDYSADSPPGDYYADSPSGDYSADSSPGNYSADSPPGDYSADSPPGDYSTDSPPGDYCADPPPRRYYSDNPADILQLCVGDRCIIIQLGYCDQVPNNLRSFLTDPETTFVGVCNSQDARKLARCSHQLEIGVLLDIRRFVKDSRGRSMRGRSFEAVVKECMGYHGVRLDREISMSDWSVYDLHHDQILQASLDAYFCSHLGFWARLWEV